MSAESFRSFTNCRKNFRFPARLLAYFSSNSLTHSLSIASALLLIGVVEIGTLVAKVDKGTSIKHLVWSLSAHNSRLPVRLLSLALALAQITLIALPLPVDNMATHGFIATCPWLFQCTTHYRLAATNQAPHTSIATDQFRLTVSAVVNAELDWTEPNWTKPNLTQQLIYRET